jgi:diguanylate cyclase
MNDAVSSRIRAEQIATIIRYSPGMMLANSCNALILVAALWTSSEGPAAIAWASVVVGFAIFYGMKSQHSLTARPQFVSARVVTRAACNALLLGSLWGALPLLFFGKASSGGQLIITCLSAGMLCGGAFAFASIPVAAIAFTGPIFIGSAIAIATNGDSVYFLVALLMVVYTGVLLSGVFAHALQLTYRLMAQIEVETEMRKDSLTGLPNRLAFEEQLQSALARMSRSGEQFALFYLDLDDFKSVNDKFGHAVGDKFLVLAADRLRSITRNIDTTARLAGDEFAVIAETIKQPAQTTMLAKTIVEMFDDPFVVAGIPIMATVSIGIAMAPSDGGDAESLLKSADSALYRAKRRMGGAVQFFDSRHSNDARERRALEQDLRGALDRGEFFLVFQPMLNLKKGRVSSCEALLRWKHPAKGIIGPMNFIRTAEETGLIDPIGEWVIRQACQFAVSWPHNIKVAVNFSAAQFRNAGILPVIVSALADATLSPSRLEIEVTESVFISETDIGLHLLNDLHQQALGLCSMISALGIPL